MTVRVVLDANVLVSALISMRGAPVRVVALWEAGAVEVAMSPATWDELTRVLRYPRLQRYLPQDAVERLLRELPRHVVWVEPTATIEVIERDPSDNRYLECAVAAGASYLVTGDEHLLALGSYGGIEILSPAGFVAAEVLWGDTGGR